MQDSPSAASSDSSGAFTKTSSTDRWLRPGKGQPLWAVVVLDTMLECREACRLSSRNPSPEALPSKAPIKGKEAEGDGDAAAMHAQRPGLLASTGPVDLKLLGGELLRSPAVVNWNRKLRKFDEFGLSISADWKVSLFGSSPGCCRLS